ncbi:unnamed protein product [Ambrosiozyma monospora]|uniref:Unnamed protein product n=1 Tax=Ambrosiozyma monospora TaxID=43982 RepID=A0A9W7DIV4_AMBMO|nr:unnamed protein product [Ambrosiozyma monospora]
MTQISEDDEVWNYIPNTVSFLKLSFNPEANDHHSTSPATTTAATLATASTSTTSSSTTTITNKAKLAGITIPSTIPQLDIQFCFKGLLLPEFNNFKIIYINSDEPQWSDCVAKHSLHDRFVRINLATETTKVRIITSKVDDILVCCPDYCKGGLDACVVSDRFASGFEKLNTRQGVLFVRRAIEKHKGYQYFY